MGIFRKTSGWLAKLKEMPLLSRINKRTGWVITVIALLLISAGGYAYYKLVYVPAQTAATASTAALQTAVVRAGKSDHLCQRKWHACCNKPGQF